MAAKTDDGDDDPAADPCGVAGKVVCGISASLFCMDYQRTNWGYVRKISDIWAL